MMKMQKKAPSTDKNIRRRGRPAGKNRTPLSLEERRARNAQYERERRNETADAMAELAEAACCNPEIANAELLATVISQLQRRAKRKLPENIEELKRTNQNLESQIAILQSRLGPDVDVDNLEEDFNDCEQLSDTSIAQTEETLPREFNSYTTNTEPKSNIQPRKERQRSNKIRKTSRTSSVCEKASESDTDTKSDTSSNSDWYESQAKTETRQYKLRNRSQTVSDQSECTTSTYLYRTESESSHCGRPNTEQFEDSNQASGLEHSTNVPNDQTLPAIQEQIEEFIQNYDGQTETALLETLTEGEKRIINDWLDTSETLNDETDNEISQVRKFLDFDDFLVDINA